MADNLKSEHKQRKIYICGHTSSEFCLFAEIVKEEKDFFLIQRYQKFGKFKHPCLAKIKREAFFDYYRVPETDTEKQIIKEAFK